MDRFQSMQVIITGGASGIGRAAALAFSANGAEVGLIDLDQERLSEVADEIGARGGKVRTAVEQLTGDESAIRAVSTLEFDRVDVLVNSAGIDLAAGLQETSEDALDKILSVNLKAPFFLCKRVVPLMPEGSSIVNVSSGAGLVPIHGRPGYNASKGALISFTKSLALDLAPSIRVNCVCPGAIDTPLLRKSIHSPQGLDMVVSRYPLRRLGQAQEVAEAIVFLSSMEARYITGIAFPVDGGRTLH